MLRGFIFLNFIMDINFDADYCRYSIQKHNPITLTELIQNSIVQGRSSLFCVFIFIYVKCLRKSSFYRRILNFSETIFQLILKFLIFFRNL